MHATRQQASSLVVVRTNDTLPALFFVEPRQFAGCVLPWRPSARFSILFELINSFCQSALPKLRIGRA